MKKISLLLVLVILLMLSGCGLLTINTSKTTKRTSSSDTTQITKTDKPTSPTTKTTGGITTTTKTKENITTKPFEQVDYSNLSLTHNNNINETERIIEKTIDSFTESNNSSIKNKRRDNDIKPVDVYNTIDTYGLNFTGDFHEYSYYGSINEAALKVSAEPLSYAFGLLESFIQQGKALEDYSGTYYFYTNGNGSIRITYFEEVEDLVAIDYYEYHMIIGTSDDNSFVLSYNFDDDGNDLYIEYETPDNSVLYLSSQTGFYGETDSLIQLFDLLDGFSGLPLYIMKMMNTEDDKIIPLSPKYDEKNPMHRLLLNDNSRGYLSRGVLQSLFFRLKYEFAVYHEDKQIYFKEDDTLLSVYGFSIPYTLVIPNGIKTIKSLTPHDSEGNKLEDDERNRLYYYAIYIPESVEKIDEDALNDFVLTDYVFFESEKENKDVEEIFLKHNPGIHFLYNGEWEILFGLYLPSCYHHIEASDHKHVYTDMIISDEYKAQDATCEHGTYYYYACEECGIAGSLIYEVGEKTSHEYVERSRNSYFVYYQCKNCGISYTKDLNDREHDFVLIEHKNPTCDEDGYDYYVCSITQEERTPTIEKYHHTYINGTCFRCHKSIDEEEHIFKLENTRLSCNSSYNRYVCTICGDIKQEDIRNIPHEYKDGFCTMCGTAEHECDYTNWFSSLDKVLRYCTICGHSDYYYPEEDDLVYEYTYSSIKENYIQSEEDINKGSSLELDLYGAVFDEEEQAIKLTKQDNVENPFFLITNNTNLGNIFYITITYKTDRAHSHISLMTDVENEISCMFERSSDYTMATIISVGFNPITEESGVILNTLSFYIYSGEADLYIKSIKIVAKPLS